MSNKKQLLDPINTMCKIIALNFMKPDSKIGIRDHVIIVQSPDYQWYQRYTNKDSHEDMCNLLIVIYRLINWYIIPSNILLSESEKDIYIEKNKISDKDIIFHTKIRKLSEYMCLGLKCLQNTYKFSNVSIVIQTYINLLSDSLAGKYDEKYLPEEFVKDQTINKNFLDFEKMKNVWTYKDIERVCELYDSCFKISSEATTDKLSENYSNNSYLIAKKIISGYLKAIDDIMEITDVEFRKLIESNNTG